MAEPLIIPDTQSFKRLVSHLVTEIARDVIYGRRGYIDAEDLVCFCIRDWPHRDYEFSLDLLSKIVARYAMEQSRVISAIRERAQRLIATKTKPQAIKSAVLALDKNRLISESEITEILRAEWVAARK